MVGVFWPVSYRVHSSFHSAFIKGTFMTSPVASLMASCVIHIRLSTIYTSGFWEPNLGRVAGSGSQGGEFRELATPAVAPPRNKFWCVFSGFGAKPLVYVHKCSFGVKWLPGPSHRAADQFCCQPTPDQEFLPVGIDRWHNS